VWVREEVPLPQRPEKHVTDTSWKVLSSEPSSSSPPDVRNVTFLILWFPVSATNSVRFPFPFLQTLLSGSTVLGESHHLQSYQTATFVGLLNLAVSAPPSSYPGVPRPHRVVACPDGETTRIAWLEVSATKR